MSKRWNLFVFFFSNRLLLFYSMRHRAQSICDEINFILCPPYTNAHTQAITVSYKLDIYKFSRCPKCVERAYELPISPVLCQSISLPFISLSVNARLVCARTKSHNVCVQMCRLSVSSIFRLQIIISSFIIICRLCVSIIHFFYNTSNRLCLLWLTEQLRFVSVISGDFSRYTIFLCFFVC